MGELLTIPEVITLTGKSKSTILRFIRKHKHNNPNQKEILLVQKGITREYKVTRSLIEKNFVFVSGMATANKTPPATDHTTDQTTDQTPATSQIQVIENLYKQLLVEREKRILEQKNINSRLIDENNDLRAFNRQFSGYFANLTKTLQLRDGKTNEKPTTKQAKNKQKQAGKRKKVEHTAKANKTHRTGGKQARTTVKKHTTKKNLLQKIFGF